MKADEHGLEREHRLADEDEHEYRVGEGLGALVGAGMSDERARVYKTAIEEGGIVMTVPPRSLEEA